MSPASAFRNSADQNLVFVSYSHADAKWLTGIRTHLKPLERRGVITQWDDSKIKPGTQWREEIQTALESARVAVLLVSADFLASDFIASNELPPLLKAAKERGTMILALIVRPCRFEKTELAQFQTVNPPSKPLSALSSSRREEWYVKLSGLIEDALAFSSPGSLEWDKRPTKKAEKREAPRPKEGGANPVELAKRHQLRLRFWAQLLDLARKQGLPFHANRSPTTSNWTSGKAGIAGYRLNYVIWMQRAAVELNIDTGEKRRNKRLFDALRSRKMEIEAAFGAALDWQRLDDARRSSIRYIVPVGGLYAPEAEWTSIQAAMIDAMSRLSTVLQPHLRSRADDPSTSKPSLDHPIREVLWGLYTVREFASGTIEVQRNGKQVTPTMPVLREIASQLKVGLLNHSGNPMNTRQLGNRIITHIQQLGMSASQSTAPS